MLSMHDLLDCCDLDKEVIEAIAEHEHIPLPIAVGMGAYLLGSTDGLRTLHSMIIENMQHAVERGNHKHADKLATIYQRLQHSHPLPKTGRLSTKPSSREARM